MVSAWVFGAALILAALYDVTERRVPNALNVLLLLGGCAASVVAERAIWDIGLGVLCAFVVVLPFFHFRVYRGGDAKLLIACGAWLSELEWLLGFAIGMAFGALHALGLLLRDKEERKRASRSLFILYLSRLGSLGDERDGARPTVPMALSFGAGMLIMMCVDTAPYLGENR